MEDRHQSTFKCKVSQKLRIFGGEIGDATQPESSLFRYRPWLPLARPVWRTLIRAKTGRNPAGIILL
ncbi:hypothetical protein CU100_15940 [Phyllobacterium endophyticum]|uniref:Uncharacterized protein n=1 Tax=Phyllobacterium endophyticum TaxID=1149773 RepID=A0A2P7ARL8_9HYPH|nr:hypothetical protein CU100_15940 [Phyllobacterium endophyticum]